MPTSIAYNHDTGQALAGLRGQLGLSQFNVAAKAGVTINTLRRIESGGNVRLSNLIAVLDALGCGLVVTLPTSDVSTDSNQ